MPISAEDLAKIKGRHQRRSTPSGEDVCSWCDDSLCDVPALLAELATRTEERDAARADNEHYATTTASISEVDAIAAERDAARGQIAALRELLARALPVVSTVAEATNSNLSIVAVGVRQLESDIRALAVGEEETPREYVARCHLCGKEKRSVDEWRVSYTMAFHYDRRHKGWTDVESVSVSDIAEKPKDEQ